MTAVRNVYLHYPYLQEKRIVIDLTGVEIVLQIVRFASLSSDVCELTIKRRNMSADE